MKIILYIQKIVFKNIINYSVDSIEYANCEKYYLITMSNKPW